MRALVVARGCRKQKHANRNQRHRQMRKAAACPLNEGRCFLTLASPELDERRHVVGGERRRVGQPAAGFLQLA